MLVGAAPVKVAAPVPVVVLLGPTGVAVAEPGVEDPGAVPFEAGTTPPVPAAPVGRMTKPVPAGATVTGAITVGVMVVRLMGGGTTVRVEVADVTVTFVAVVVLVLVENAGVQPGTENVPLMLPESP